MKLTIKSTPEIVIELDSAQEEKKIALENIVAVPKTEPEPIPKSKRGRPPKSGARCSNCGETGHRKPTCPNDKKGKEQDNPFDNDLADKIEGMKDEGFSAQYIADDLRIPLETVKRYY